MSEHNATPDRSPGTPQEQPTGNAKPKESASERPLWTNFKAFMKVHWRITLAIFCTVGVVVMPFADDTVESRVGGTLFYFLAAVVFWTLHVRHRARGGNATASGQRVRPDAHVTLDTSIDDGWSQRLLTCRDKAGVFHEVGAATRSDSVRDWLAAMADDIERQMVQAEDLAALGRSVEPEFTGRGEPAHSSAREAWSRLGQFEAGLDDAVTGAAEVRMNSLSPAVSVEAIRGQLDMLKSQLPTLDTV